MKMNRRILITFLLGVSFVFFACAQKKENSDAKTNAKTQQSGTSSSSENSSPSQSPTITHTGEIYNVTFSTGEGAGKEPQPLWKKSGDAVVLPGPDGMTAPKDMEFDRWLADDGKKVAAGSDYRITNNVTFTAQWRVSPVSLRTDVEQMTKDIATVNTKIKILAVAEFLLLVASILLFVFTKKKYKKDINELKQKTRDLDVRLSNVPKNQNASSYSSSPPDNGAAFQKIEKRLDEFEKLYELQKKLNDEFQKRAEKSESSYIPPARPPSTLSPIEAYNAWAANPVSSLPTAFTYLEGDMRMREEQNLKPTANESMWITNKDGSQKYLFPNPNLFDQMTDLKDTYKIDISELKPKGQNRIRIITPCKLSDNGFIVHKGELELL
jgi:preprotein translocase subunit SecG